MVLGLLNNTNSQWLLLNKKNTISVWRVKYLVGVTTYKMWWPTVGEASEETWSLKQFRTFCRR